MTDMPVVFKIFKILIPTLVLIMFCAGLCKGIQRAWRRRREHEQDIVVQEQTSIYIIPTLPPAQGFDSTPHRPPPSYDELILKPDLTPHYPPPSYSESISPPPNFSSEPTLIPPPYSSSQDLEPNSRTPT